MDIREKAKQYADGKALSAINAAIEEAYAEGYKSGYEDGYAKREEVNPIVLNDGVEYVDLALPSGTKWSSYYLKDDEGKILYLSHLDALKYNIPTKEQYEELRQWCRISDHIHTSYRIRSVDYVGRNGKTILLDRAYIFMGVQCYDDEYRFWLKDSADDIKSLCVVNGNVEDSFKGWKMPIMLVK